MEFVNLLTTWVSYFVLALVAAGAASLIYNKVTGAGPVKWGTVVVLALMISVFYVGSKWWKERQNDGDE